MKHTPGPWIIGKINTGPVSGSVPIYTEGYATSLRSGQLICSVYGTASFSDANAALIAAAPELLSELIAYHDREWREDHEGIPAHHAGDFPDECGACAVIVKATGGE